MKVGFFFFFLLVLLFGDWICGELELCVNNNHCLLVRVLKVFDFGLNGELEVKLVEHCIG